MDLNQRDPSTKKKHIHWVRLDYILVVGYGHWKEQYLPTRGDGSNPKSQIQNSPTKQKETRLNLFCTSTHAATTKKTVERTSQFVSLWLVGIEIFLFIQFQHATTLCSQCVNSYWMPKIQFCSGKIQLFQHRTWMHITLGGHMNSGLQLFHVRKSIRIIFKNRVRKQLSSRVCENKSSRHDTTAVA